MFDLATAKARLSITDATQDAVLQTTLDASLAFAEVYCDRKFMYADETANFYHTHDGSVQLHRYPIGTIHSVAPSVKYQVHHQAGIVDFHGVEYKEKIAISYGGGYRTLPAALRIGADALAVVRLHPEFLEPALVADEQTEAGLPNRFSTRRADEQSEAEHEQRTPGQPFHPSMLREGSGG